VRVALDVSAVPEHVAGAGRYVVEIARRLPGRGVATTLVSRRDDADRWRNWSPDATVAPLVPTHRASRLASEAWRLGRSDVARSAEVWHAPHYTMPHSGSTPTVVTIHDLTFFTHPQWHEAAKVAFFRRAIRYAAAHAAALICVSERTARELAAHAPGTAPVVVAPHGVDFTRFTPVGANDGELLRAAGHDARRPYLLFVGTSEPRKGLDVLLDAFVRVAELDPDVELWLAGQAGWGESVDDALSRHAHARRVRRLGYVDEALLPALMRASRAVVYPSRAEGFGLPVLEAMACGSMVVTSADTVMAEVAGEAARLVTVGDADDLAAALGEALGADDAERRRRGAAAAARASLFTWDASLDHHLRAYEIAMGGGACAR